MGDKIGLPIHCWQTLANGSRSVIGEVRDYDLSGNTITWSLKSQNAVLDPSLDITFAALGAYDRYFTFPSSDFTGADLNYDVDEFGRKLLKDDNGIWSGTILRKTFKKQFVSLSSGDLIRVEGEDKFRKIKLLPSSATSKDGRPGRPVSNDVYASVSVETYAGVTRGEGLSVIAIIENGSVTSLKLEPEKL